ncbi:hypothetical protein AG1IA_01632 [Rhizoctonia solani AG-1 IA]|uniref:Uncharacterized protein n=1 Tax=Thanatephorus cucumeris (strain AG1-IA) TaxID=983506 RepID=L8X2A1_THACA|nr:hypothetical protein AG1IA_01632 [Rhizoctonia solani AG-1 IA]
MIHNGRILTLPVYLLELSRRGRAYHKIECSYLTSESVTPNRVLHIGPVYAYHHRGDKPPLFLPSYGLDKLTLDGIPWVSLYSPCFF